jgi:hypothetical protein
MGFSLTINSLSALNPVKFVYNFNKEEKLSSSLSLYKNGFGYYSHSAFTGFKDAALSKKSCLILTDIKSLKAVFENDSKNIQIGEIAGCLFLKTQKNKYVTTKNNQMYIGGTGEKLFVNIVPMTNDTVELVTTCSKKIQIDKNYPYTARLSEDVLYDEDVERQRFKVEYKDNLISFKTKTVEGYRYLSFGVDLTLRAVGVVLNETYVNSYYFVPDSVSLPAIEHDFTARTNEIKYFNELNTDYNKKNTNVREIYDSDANLLVSCPTSEISKSNNVSINIALLKTNFSSSGTYLNKKT